MSDAHPPAPANPVGWFEIYVQDLPRARAFYEAVFAKTLTPMPAPDDAPLEMLAFPYEDDAPGCGGALVHMKDTPMSASPGGGTVVYFSCEDCATEIARVPAAGGTVEQDKFPIGPYGHIAMARDPDSNLFGLHSLK